MLELPSRDADRAAQSPHSWASFTPDGVDDAKRCAPAGSLEGFASARGLVYHGPLRWAYLPAVAPLYRERMHNACVGVLGGRRYGLVGHELLPVGFTTTQNSTRIDMPGAFHGEHLRDPWVKVLNPLSDLRAGEGPFARGEAVVPTSVVAVHVPEAALIPSFTVASTQRMHKRARPLDRFGLGGFRLNGAITEEQEDSVFVPVVRDALNAIDGEYVRVQLTCSQLHLMRDGFLDDAGLDGLVDRAVVLADALAASQTTQPQAFADPLPDAPVPVAPRKQRGLRLGPITIGVGMPKPDPDATDPDGWGAGFARAAKEFRLVSEDPDAFHRAFPRIQAPGRARGVLRGELPGGLHGRLSLHLYEPGATTGRSAVTFAAAPGTPDSPPGGVVHEPTRQRVAVADGLVTCWNEEILQATIGTDDTSRRALATAQALGLV